jgi:hypothetical protein
MEIICPIFSKDDQFTCSNYRGITLLSVVYKVFSSTLLNQRLKVIAELIFGEYQAGFREKKSTIDQIFVLKQIMEKHYEFGLELHLLFMDYKQIFDSINRTELFAVMEKMNIPHKLIGLTKMTLNKTTATLKIKDKLSQEFDFNVGVKQGDGLSTTLFIMALHDAIKNVDQRGAIFTKSSQIFAYADDTVIVARSENKLIQVYKNLGTYTLKL